jgi:uncharacterized delta-60 repeat protein
MRRRSYLVGMVFAGLAIVVPPSAPVWAVTSGNLDPTFGTNGTVLTDVGGLDVAYGMAVQSDGRIVVAGFSNMGGSYDFALARYGGGGTLDPTFGAGGTVLTDVDATGSYDEARAVATQPDGKIVAAGSSDASGNSDFAVVRYNHDGTPDRTFGTGGTALTDASGAGRYDAAYAVAVQPDGKILAAGSSDASGSSDFAVVRYNHDGTPDRTFGTGGTVITDLGGTDYAYAMALCGDGRIVVAGSSDAAGSLDFALARYTVDGTLDSGFGRRGTALTDVNGVGSDDEARAVVVRADGEVVAAGRSNAVRRTDRDFALARYRNDGNLDSSFGHGGTVLTDVGGGSDDVALAVAIQPDCKIVAAGGSGRWRTDNFALARYRDDGTMDPTFGAAGTVVTDISGVRANNEAFAVAIQPDGKILTAGVASGVGWADFAAARYQP